MIRFHIIRTLRAASNSVCAAAVLLATSLSVAFAQRATGSGQSGTFPDLAPARPLHLPTIVQKELPNGLKLVILEDHRQPAVWLKLAIGAGSSRDPSDRVGLAVMTAKMLDKGTTSRSEYEIYLTKRGLGASLGASASEDYLMVSASGLSNFTDNLFDLLGDVTMHTTFPTEVLESIRTNTLTDIEADLSAAGTMADAAIRRRVYGSHPYGNFAMGTAASVKAIAQKDLVQFHNRLFAPNNSTLFIVGDIAADKAIAKAQARFRGWIRREVPKAPGPPMSAAPIAAGAQVFIVDRPGAEQTEVRIGLLTLGWSDPKLLIAYLGSVVLGVGQFDGRLTKEIRVKRGLTYAAFSSFERKGRGGIFVISTFTKNVSTGEVVKIALPEARRLQSEPTLVTELQDGKNFMNGSFALSVATTAGALKQLESAVLCGAGPEALTRWTIGVQAVTSGEIEEYMRSLPLDRPQIVLVGDAAIIEPQVKGIGTVTIVPSGSLDLQSPTLGTQVHPAVPAPPLTPVR